MDMKVVKREKNVLEVELPEDTVTVSNVVKDELWNDKNVAEAAQVKEHPYLENPKVFVKTSRGKPETALDKAADRVIKRTEEFSEAFSKAVKE